ncbi:MAG: bifunctional heptose 7-phosphate kinase/heptose 1-phosphate adenyltransferase [Planctomycetota bacterium]
MERSMLSELAQRFSQLGRPRILVLGDLMLDRYTWGDAERVSPEAPVIVLRADQEEIRPGGAASVAYLLRHLDADVSVVGVVGNDADGHTLRALLRDEGIDEQFVVLDPTRPTTSKQRLVGRASDRHPHQILRVDRESREPLSDALTGALWETLQHQLPQFDAILVADYLKGVCTERLLQAVISAARANGQPVLVDPGRLADYGRYRGATLIKPNRVEAELVSGRPLTNSQDVLVAARQLCLTFQLDSVVITLDRNGLVVVAPTGDKVIATDPRAVYDITGAGDMVLATLGLCLAGGTELLTAAHIANLAAGLEVERFGIAPVSRSEIGAKLRSSTNPSASKIVTADEVSCLAEGYRRQGKRIVFTNGCFDLLHVGHVSYLQEAATLGDILIVAINSDVGVQRLKGLHRPVIPERDRAQMLAALSCINHVLIFEEETPLKLLELIHPEVLVKGATTANIVGREFVESYGGRILRVESIIDCSTTQILHHILSKSSDFSFETINR